MSYLSDLWARFRAKPAPQPQALSEKYPGSILTDVGLWMPAPPAVRQEQFADIQAEVQRQEQRVQTLYRQVVAGNNRAVTRDYGTHVADETRVLKPEFAAAAPMTEADWRELKDMNTGVTYVQPKHG